MPSYSRRFREAFAEFAASALLSRLHEALVRDTLSDRLVGLISRDSSGDRGYGKTGENQTKPAPAPKPKLKRGRPRKGSAPPPFPAESGSNPNGA